MTDYEIPLCIRDLRPDETNDETTDTFKPLAALVVNDQVTYLDYHDICKLSAQLRPYIFAEFARQLSKFGEAMKNVATTLPKENPND